MGRGSTIRSLQTMVTPAARAHPVRQRLKKRAPCQRGFIVARMRDVSLSLRRLDVWLMMIIHPPFKGWIIIINLGSDYRIMMISRTRFQDSGWQYLHHRLWQARPLRPARDPPTLAGQGDTGCRLVASLELSFPVREHFLQGVALLKELELVLLPPCDRQVEWPWFPAPPRFLVLWPLRSDDGLLLQKRLQKGPDRRRVYASDVREFFLEGPRRPGLHGIQHSSLLLLEIRLFLGSLGLVDGLVDGFNGLAATLDLDVPGSPVERSGRTPLRESLPGASRRGRPNRLR